MKLLLDTRVLLWWLADDVRLSEDVKAVIASPENVVFVSAVTFWEIAIKKALGKLSIADEWYEVVREEAFEELMVTWEHSFGVTQLPDFHRDPFDRMLVSQAACEGLVLVTHDNNVLRYDVSTLKA